MSKKLNWIVIGGVAVLALGAIWWVGWQGDPPGPGHAAAAAAHDPVLKKYLIIQPTEPVRAADFAAHPINGAKPHLHDYAGRYVLLNFWATWCGPCKVEMPEMEALHQALQEKNFSVIAVSMMEEVEKVQEFIDTTNYTFPVLADPEGIVSDLYGVRSLPLTYLIDTEGWIVARATGARNWNDPALVEYFEAQAQRSGGRADSQ